MQALVSLLLDVVVIGLLVATIIYAIRLNRQLGAVKESRTELEALVKGFTEATAQAEAGVKGMRAAALESGEALQARIAKAQALKEELEIIVQAADGVANRLESASSRARQAVQQATGHPIGAGGPAPAPSGSASAPPPRPQPAPSQPAQPGTGGAAEPRSKAEKELLQALENLRQ